MGNGLKQRIIHIVKFKDNNGKRERWMGNFERKLIELAYDETDSREPLCMVWIK